MKDEAVRLNHAIKTSEEYRVYQEKLRQVKNNPELYQAMNEFRRQNCVLQGYGDGVNRYEEIHMLSNKYENVLRHPLVNEFLVAEQILSRQMEEMYELIAEGLELDYDYME